jgi:endonuclease YncB( thermonuclease family)
MCSVWFARVEQRLPAVQFSSKFGQSFQCTSACCLLPQSESLANHSDDTLSDMLLPFRAFLSFTLLWSVSPKTIQAQNPQTAAPEVDFSHDPCGNPTIENMLRFGVEGKVLKVVDGGTILVTLPGGKRSLRVHLAGIALEPRVPFSEEAKALLTKLLLDKPVEILVNPDEWLDKKPEEITGVVSEPSLSLLSQGLVRFRQPPPYTMFRYTTCQYERAEADARSKKLGLWR